ncbi:MAG: DUF7305 domain-containing protein [Candidatus Methylomirabilis sp.]
MKMKKGRGEEGIALVITLFVMTILLIMGSAFMSISSTETLIAINERNRVQAYHLAEAAAELAIARLNVDSNYAGTGEQPLGPGTYTVTVTCVPPAAPAPPCPVATPDQRLISTTGCVRNCTPPSATSRVDVRVQPGSPFQFALLGAGTGAADYRAVELENSVQVDSYDSAVGPYNPFSPGTQGHIHSNGKIQLGTNNLVKGNAQAVGSITPVGPGNVITGTSTPGVPSQSVANITIPPPSGDINVAIGGIWTLAPGTYSYNQITMGNNSSLVIFPPGQVTIYMTGRFSAGSGAKINPFGVPTNLLIFSNNNGTDDPPAPSNGEEAFYFDNDNGMGAPGEFYGAIYAPNGEVELQNATDPNRGWKIYGAIVAKKLDIEDYAQFHYDLALAQASIPGVPGTKFRPVAGAWQERLPSN